MTAFLKDVIGYGLHAARPVAGSAGALYYETDTDTLLRDNGATWDALTLGSNSPLTTKGDVFVHGTSDARLPVGTDGQVLTADSTQTLGVKWAAPGSSSGALTKIDEVVVGAGGAATISFTSIAGTYRSLHLVTQARGSAAANAVNVLLQCNADSGANYDWQNIEGAGSGTPGAGGARAATSARVAQISAASSPSGAAGQFELLLPNYAATTFRKMGTAKTNYTWDDSGSTGFLADFYVMCWRSTAALTAIALSLSSGNFVQGSTATLYGLS